MSSFGYTCHRTRRPRRRGQRSRAAVTQQQTQSLPGRITITCTTWILRGIESSHIQIELFESVVVGTNGMYSTAARGST